MVRNCGSIILPIIIFIFFACQGVDAQTIDTLRYTLVRPSSIDKGAKLIWRIGKNDIYFNTAYNDRGRGPSITEHVKVDDEGKIIIKEITGFNYFKANVNERFYVNNGKPIGKMALRMIQLNSIISFILPSMTIMEKAHLIWQ